MAYIRTAFDCGNGCVCGQDPRGGSRPRNGKPHREAAAIVPLQYDPDEAAIEADFDAQATLPCGHEVAAARSPQGHGLQGGSTVDRNLCIVSCHGPSPFVGAGETCSVNVLRLRRFPQRAF